MMRFAGTAANLRPMALPGRKIPSRSGSAFRAGDVLLAIGLARLSRKAPVTYAVSRTALRLARRRMLVREAERRAMRRKRIRRSIVAGTMLVAAAAGTRRALAGGRP
jgi:hypothetical protein